MRMRVESIILYRRYNIFMLSSVNIFGVIMEIVIPLRCEVKEKAKYYD